VEAAWLRHIGRERRFYNQQPSSALPDEISDVGNSCRGWRNLPGARPSICETDRKKYLIASPWHYHPVGPELAARCGPSACESPWITASATFSLPPHRSPCLSSPPLAPCLERPQGCRRRAATGRVRKSSPSRPSLGPGQQRRNDRAGLLTKAVGSPNLPVRTARRRRCKGAMIRPGGWIRPVGMTRPIRESPRVGRTRPAGPGRRGTVHVTAKIHPVWPREKTSSASPPDETKPDLSLHPRPDHKPNPYRRPQAKLPLREKRQIPTFSPHHLLLGNSPRHKLHRRASTRRQSRLT
jgi:hypothetical protein